MSGNSSEKSMLERINHYESFPMSVLSPETGRLPLRRCLSVLPGTTQAQLAQGLGTQTKSREAKVLGGAGAGMVHPIGGKLKGSISSLVQLP